MVRSRGSLKKTEDRSAFILLVIFCLSCIFYPLLNSYPDWTTSGSSYSQNTADKLRVRRGNNPVWCLCVFTCLSKSEIRQQNSVMTAVWNSFIFIKHPLRCPIRFTFWSNKDSSSPPALYPV